MTPLFFYTASAPVVEKTPQKGPFDDFFTKQVQRRHGWV